MTISELKKMIEVAETLGHGEAELCINDSRDGEASFPHANAEFVRAGRQGDQYTILAVSRK